MPEQIIKKFLIITTVGTSLLADDETLRERLNEEQNEYNIKYSKENYESEIRKKTKRLTNVYKDYCELISSGDSISMEKFSAEIASLLKIRDALTSDTEKRIGKLIFLASDTFSGQFCADVNSQFAQEIEIAEDCSVILVNNLEVKKKDKFEEGLNELERISNEIINSEGEYETVLNITGGFKGAIPKLSQVAINRSKKMLYYHSDSEELLEIIFVIEKDGSVKAETRKIALFIQ